MGSVLTTRVSRWLVSLALALVTVACAAAPARAAFPGVPGPIAYPKRTFGEIEDSGGLFAHGPSKRQSPHQLTSSYGDDAPAYSPNGRMIVFAGNRDPGEAGDYHLYLMSADGSGVRALTSGDFFDSNPSFSPNGQQVVFDRAPASGRRSSHIFIVNVDGSGLRRLTDNAGTDYDPTFAPNGRRIAFVSNRDVSARSDHSDIFSMSPSGTHLRVLIGGPRDEYDPDFSPNGRRIAFASNRDHGPNIFVARSNGRRALELTHSRHDCFESACYFGPSWAPDGKHIAFLSVGRYSSTLQVMRSDGTHGTEFADAGTEEEGYGDSIGAPAWGPAPR
jgi:Tol biopolymer transport system component